MILNDIACLENKTGLQKNNFLTKGFCKLFWLSMTDTSAQLLKDSLNN